MHFASSGPDALVLVEQEPFDVVVSDMRMPEMDGAALLAEVQKKNPGSVRIILSGQADEESVTRAYACAHHYLGKPCEPEHLQRVIEGFLHLRDVLDSPTLRELVGTSADLPMNPTIYAKLVEAMGNEEVSIPQLASIVEHDAGLASQILRLANSGFFALRRPATTVSTAINFVGAKTLRYLVLQAEVFGHARDVGDMGHFSLDALQQHSVLVGHIAQDLVNGPDLKSQAFLAGLIHDVGKLVLLVRATDAYREVLQKAHRGRSLLELERETLGATHAEVGAYVLGLWGLPPVLLEPLARHHDPGELEGDEIGLTHALYLANLIAHKAVDDDPNATEPYPAWIAQVGLEERMDDILENARTALETTAAV